MEMIREWLPIILEPKNLVILIIVFSVVLWILNTIKFVSSIILKLLIAAAIVVFVAYLLGIDDITTLAS